MSGQQNPNKQIPTRAHVEKAFQTILDACEATAYLQPGSQDAYPNRYVQPGSQDAYPNRYVQPGSQSALPHRIGGPLTVSKYGSTGLTMSQQVAQGMINMPLTGHSFPAVPVARPVPTDNICPEALRYGLENVDERLTKLENGTGLIPAGPRVLLSSLGDGFFHKPANDKNFIEDVTSAYEIRTEEGKKAFDQAKQRFKRLSPQQSDTIAYAHAKQADEAAASAGSSKKAKIGVTQADREAELKNLLEFETSIEVDGDDVLEWAKTHKAAKKSEKQLTAAVMTVLGENLGIKGYVYFSHEAGRNPFKKPNKEDHDAFQMYKRKWGFNEADDWDGTI